MAYRYEKETGDIVIDGFEQGISPSPHKGIANIQNANIATETGEVINSFARAKNNPQATITNGTLTASVGDGAIKLAAPSTLYGGQWINISSSTILGNSVNPTNAISYLVVGGGGAGGASQAGTQAGGGGGGGQVVASTSTVSVQAYTITVGNGGTGGTGDGGTGGSSSFGAIATAVGGGGGGKGSTPFNGAGGASGGGAGANSGGNGTGGVATHGHNGGDSSASTQVAAGGGGGSGTVGQNGITASGTGGAGGSGTASSITGASVNYAGGGGGSGQSVIGAGTDGGGSGGLGIGTAGTANTGGGGGGSGNSGGNHNGANGGSGVVIISYVTGSMTATGGSITTSGGNTIHTFNSSGTFTVTQVLLSGNYYISYKDGSNKVKLSDRYDPYCQNAITHGTSGTATFSTVAIVNKPIAKATEIYQNATSTQYRYYILDANSYVWVYDTAVYADSLANAGIGVTWALADPTDNSALLFTGLAVLNGWLMTVNNLHIYGKPTVNLGKTFVAINSGNLNNPFPTHSNFAFVGHQGRMYWCDGNYIGSLFPDTSILTGDVNIQSNASYTAVTTTGTMTAVIGGSLPNDNLPVGTRVPAVFFTDVYGTQPTNLTADTIYYIANGAATKTFNVYSAISGGSPIDIAAGAAGNQYFNTFYPLGGDAGAGGTDATATISLQRVNLPTFEVAQTMTEVGNLVIIGCISNALYPWDQVALTPSNVIFLPEANTQTMITVNQMAYVFPGNKGNVYITDGNVASAVTTVPDYCAGVPGTPSSYIESYFSWGDAAYIRGRVYFSILDQTASKAGNCGGIWSFIPTQNLYIGQDVGIALRLENQNSYGTYNGYATVILPNQNQAAVGPQFWTGWESSISGPTYGIDTSDTGTQITSVTVVESDAMPTGTMLDRKSFERIEVKFATPLLSSDVVTLAWRKDLTSAWSSAVTARLDNNKLSAYVPANFEKTQWFQIQATLKPGTASSFVRLKEMRLH